MEQDRLTLLHEFVQREKAIRKLEAMLDEEKKSSALLKDQIMRDIFESGTPMQNITIDGMNVFLHRQIRANAQKGQREQLVQALKDEGLGAMVDETFNANTLSSWVRDFEREGGARGVEEIMEQLPVSVREHISIVELFDVRARMS